MIRFLSLACPGPTRHKASRRFRRGSWLLLAAGLLSLPPSSGCAYSKQIQYFAAIDPDTAEVNYYRMTATGRSGLLNKYTLKAGYFNAITLDALTGSLSDPPEVSGCEDQLEAVAEIREIFFDALTKEAKAARDAGEGERSLVRIARALWVAGADQLTVASIGYTGSLNPYVFKKLVFWAEADPIDLQQFQGQFDNIVRNSFAVVAGMRERAKKRKAEKESEKQQRNALINSVFGQIIPAASPLAPFRSQISAALTGTDQCPDDPSKLLPGVCGCGQPDVDTDADGTLDCDDGCPRDRGKTEPGRCGCGVVDPGTGESGSPLPCPESTAGGES